MNEQLTNRKTRLLSLDAFRGFTIAGMILVNNPGDWGNIYTPFEHADWNGCTFADLIFPFFLFISGVSISYALGSKLRDKSSHHSLLLKITKRSAILFALGIILAFIPYIFQNPAEALRTVRIPGILQRIALVYYASAILFLKTNWKTQLSIGILLLLAYWVLMSFVPVPGFGPANLGKETNLGAWLDRLILTENHLWKLSKTWDPEGILGTLPSIATGISGVLTGNLLRMKGISNQTKIGGMLLSGLALFLAGLFWGKSFPINKSLWTSSYVLFTSGLALIALCAFYLIIDIRGHRAWAKPFIVYGSNAITAFFTTTLAAKIFNVVPMHLGDGTKTNLKGWIYSSFYQPFFSPLNASFAFALTFVLAWLIILWWMYSKKIIIKV